MQRNNIFDPSYKPPGYYNCTRREILNFIPTECKKILDVGCGEGSLGSLLKNKRNAEVWGVEISESAAQKATDKIDKVIIADFEKNNAELPEKYFDCIIFNDVLEHFLYPWIVLRNSRSFLKESGYFIGSIPNVRCFPNIKNLLFRKEWSYEDSGILDKTHVRFFTKKSAKTMLELCGYQVVKTIGIYPYLSFKFELLNLILLNSIKDMRYHQFVYVAKLKEKYPKIVD